MLKIEVRGSKQYFFLNSEEYSSYSYEQEVLMQEGNKYKVVGVEDMTVETMINQEEVALKVAVVKLVTLGDKYSRVGCCKRACYYLTN